MWNFPLFPPSASSLSPHVDGLLYFLLAITIFFSVLIAALIIFLAVRYRHGNNTVDRTDEGGGHLWLELTWTAVPLVIVLVVFGWGVHVFYKMKQIPPDALEIFVVGKQWMWKIQHPDGQTEINALHVPVGQSIQLTMISQDVIHNFAIPAFRIKQDVLPGRYTRQWFQATKTGVYHIFCNQYCGTLHAAMIGKVYVMEPHDFQRWLSGEKASKDSMSAEGAELFSRMGCASCHLPSGRGRGPSLVGLYNKSVALATGQVVKADEAYVRESILKPQAKLVPGYAPSMPTYQGQLQEQSVLELIAYIKSLSAPAEQKDGR